MLYLLAVQQRSNKVVSIFVLLIFLTASAGAGTIVPGSMSVGGITDPNRFICLAWGAVIGAIAFVLLLRGGFDALRQATLLAGVPFALIAIFMRYALYRGFRRTSANHWTGKKENLRRSNQRASQPRTSASTQTDRTYRTPAST